MVKKYLILFIVLFLTTGIKANQTDPKIEIGDILSVYIIDKNGADIIANTFSAQANLNKDPHDIRVSQEGKIYINHVGTIHAESETAAQIEGYIKKKIQGKISFSEVSVLLITPKFNHIYVIGEVKSPGLYQLEKTRVFDQKLLNIINKAGGFTDRANIEDITIINNDKSKRTINLRKMSQNKSTSENVILNDYDTIIIPQTVARIYVLGEVEKPGGYPVIASANFSDYIAESGGYKSSADIDNISILRKENGSVNVYRASMRDHFFTKDGINYSLKTGDIIYISKNFFANWRDWPVIIGTIQSLLNIKDTIWTQYINN